MSTHAKHAGFFDPNFWSVLWALTLIVLLGTCKGCIQWKKLALAEAETIHTVRQDIHNILLDVQKLNRYRNDR